MTATLHFTDREGFLVAIREYGAKGPARWRPAGLEKVKWSEKAFELATQSVYAVDLLVSGGVDLVLQNELTFGRVHVARLALELYGAGAPFADVRCDVPIAHGRSGWSIDREGSDYYEGDALPDHAHLYSDTERASMQRDLEIATFGKLGVPEGEIRTWQEGGAS